MVLATSARGDPGIDSQRLERAIADQFSDVGSHPLGAGLDELVLVQLLDVLFERTQLLRDGLDQRPQGSLLLRCSLLCIAQAMIAGRARTGAPR